MAEFDIAPEQLVVTLPGGVVVSSAPTSSFPGESEVARQMVAQLTAAISPITAILNLASFAQAVVDLALAIPAALGPPPDPGRLGSAIDDLRVKADAVLALNPVASIPVLFRGVVGVLLSLASGLKTEIAAIAEQEAAAEAALAAADEFDEGGEPHAALTAAAQDAADLAVVSLEALSRSLDGVSAVSDVLMAVGQIVPIPAIPALEIGTDSETALASVTAWETALAALV